MAVMYAKLTYFVYCITEIMFTVIIYIYSGIIFDVIANVTLLYLKAKNK